MPRPRNMKAPRFSALLKRAQVRPADHDRLDLGQIAFLIVRKTQVELFARHQAQHGVAEELQAFVGGQARVGAGGVREGGAEQFGLAEVVADGVLAFFQNLGFAAGGQFLLHNGIAGKTGGISLKVTPPAPLVNGR